MKLGVVDVGPAAPSCPAGTQFRASPDRAKFRLCPSRYTGRSSAVTGAAPENPDQSKACPQWPQ